MRKPFIPLGDLNSQTSPPPHPFRHHNLQQRGSHGKSWGSAFPGCASCLKEGMPGIKATKRIRNAGAALCPGILHLTTTECEVHQCGERTEGGRTGKIWPGFSNHIPISHCKIRTRCANPREGICYSHVEVEGDVCINQAACWRTSKTVCHVQEKLNKLHGPKKWGASLRNKGVRKEKIFWIVKI